MRAAGLSTLALTLATSVAALAQVEQGLPPSAADMEEPTEDSFGAAVEGVPSEVTEQLTSQLFFDAAQTSINRDMSRQTFDGEVVAIGAGTIVAADHLALDRATQTLEARGHVVILSRGAVFTGEAIRYSMKTTDFAITGAVMVANDQAKADEVTRRVLGLTPREVQFEKDRKERLQEIELRKARLAREARRQARRVRPPLAPGGPTAPSVVLDPDILDRYTRLYEEEDLISAQENPSLSRLPEERRDMYKRRRAFWEQSRTSALIPQGGGLATMYFRLEGESIERTAGNDYVAKEALFTPCRCEDDEAPAWGFRADQIDAQVGGYADMRHPVLEIKGIPVLYLPFLKVPLKDQRQSGFLMPTFSFEKRAGNIYSQPVFFDLGRSADATLTTDFFENRGTRLGLEYRIQQRQFSGWELKLEGLRDRLWMRDRGVREDLRSLYSLGLEQAVRNDAAYDGLTPDQRSDLYDVKETDSDRAALERQLSDPGYWRRTYETSFPDDLPAIENELTQKLAVPSNTWRGAYAWRGVSFFAPRLSLVSAAHVTSDHRYDEELYVPDDFEKAFFGGREARAFSTARARLHLDGRDFYLGAGTAFGDNYLLDERYQGQQLPLRLKLQSRKVSLLPDSSPIPLWGQLTTEQMRITEFKPSDELRQASVARESLGDGLWQRVRFDTVSPLLTETPVQISHFSETEARFIQHAELEGHRSRIRSWTTGVDFSLPIDGKGELPGFLQDETKADEDPAGTKFGHHLMDWRLRLSARPAVVKRGEYADEGDGGLAYFASDRFDPDFQSIDIDVPEEERMRVHQRAALTTDHAWKLFRRQYTPKDAAKTAATPTGEGPLDARERARRDLIRELERPKLPDEDQLDPATGRWVVDRFTRADSYYATPVSLSAGVAYDFYDAKDREKKRAYNRENPADQKALPKAWKDPTVSASATHEGFTLAATSRYDIYARLSPAMDFSLGLPAVAATNVSLGYGVTRDAPPRGQTEFVETHERRLNIVTSLLRPVTGYIRLQRRDKDGEAPTYTNRFQTAFGLTYDSPSECWGLQFAREKEYGKLENQATYVLRFSMILMGQQRFLPNMSPAVTKEGEAE